MKPAPIPDHVIGHCKLWPKAAHWHVPVTQSELREQLRLANRLVYQLRAIIVSAGAGDGNPQYASITQDLAKWERTQL